MIKICVRKGWKRAAYGPENECVKASLPGYTLGSFKMLCEDPFLC